MFTGADTDENKLLCTIMYFRVKKLSMWEKMAFCQVTAINSISQDASQPHN